MILSWVVCDYVSGMRVSVQLACMKDYLSHISEQCSSAL